MRCMELKTEEKLILFLLVMENSAQLVSKIRELLKDKRHTVDFIRVFEHAAANEVAPIVYENLRTFDNVPIEIIARFRNAYLHSLRNNILNSEEMLRILSSLAKCGVKAIPLKGSFASDIIFDNPGIYPATDIDILVKPEDIKKAEDILNEQGYMKNEIIGSEDLLSGHYHFLYIKDSYFLELHWNLVKRYFRVPPEFWWDETEQIEYSGITISVLSHERYLMYAIFRLFDHGFRPLKFFIFIYGLLRKYKNEIDWQKLFLYSKQYKMERMLFFTLRLLNDIFHEDIPQFILQRKLTGYELIKKQVISGLFGEVKRPHLRMLFYTSLLDSPGDFFVNIIRRIFPKSSEIRLRYGISEKSRMVYMYYLLNPLIIFLKRRNPEKWESRETKV